MCWIFRSIWSGSFVWNTFALCFCDFLPRICEGARLQVNKSWKNPSGEWHVGCKFAFGLFTDTLVARIKVLPLQFVADKTCRICYSDANQYDAMVRLMMSYYALKLHLLTSNYFVSLSLFASLVIVLRPESTGFSGVYCFRLDIWVVVSNCSSSETSLTYTTC